jgi:peptidoglycan hydrolase CwlO-like protein
MSLALRRHLLPLTLACALAAIAAVLAGVGPAGADLSTRVNAQQGRAQALRAAVAAESARIRQTQRGLASAQARLRAVQADVGREQARLQAIALRLRRTRIRLTRLENRLHASMTALRANLVAAYRNPQPDVVGVVLSAHGFSDLLEKADFYKRISKQNARIMAAARRMRRQVQEQTDRLVELQADQRRVTARLGRKRDRAQALETALLKERSARLAGRASTAAELSQVNRRLSVLRKRLARQMAIPAAGPAPAGIRTAPGGAAQAPAGAPDVVKRVIAAGNAIAGLPYVYGGGHGSFKANAYDCSGSISYALAAGGLVSAPMASGPFMSWGESGPGKWITVYANAGHAYMVVAGWRFDTSALSQGGTRWTQSGRSNAGFVARHPPGL